MMASVWDKLDELRDEAKDLKEDIEGIIKSLSDVVNSDDIAEIQGVVQEMIDELDDINERLY
ncbi:hypothetical protein [Aneurinibacillus migulanus]|uniref:hypothetical protein n=1 Tax=Aneurinibacillus migulanus TaxID=47500 RepID=UPI0020A18B8C|nr:hypothetical protein [Aneurinibacillus migulanus]MCP1355433.1 hypothetical protein [Aneurinibacillus migulanus]